MTADVRTLREDLRFRLNRRPFLPFAVILQNGAKYRIMRVAQMAIGQTVGTIADMTGDNARRIKLNEISALDDL
jgi:hypothetical protein